MRNHVPNPEPTQEIETDGMSVASTSITRLLIQQHLMSVTHTFRISVDPLISTENIFGERQRSATSISPEQALIHMVKVMMGTGMLSLPLAFKYSGLWVRRHLVDSSGVKLYGQVQLGLFLLVGICAVCTYCCRLLVYCSGYVCRR